MNATDKTPLRVIAVTYNPGQTLTTFLDSLRQATAGALDIVLVDNGSTDGAAKAAQEQGLATFVPSGANLGYGRAANIGAGVGTDVSPIGKVSAPIGEWIVVANPDITWTPGSLDQILKVAADYPKAAVLGPLIMTEDGDRYPSARAFPTLGTGIGHALFVKIWPSNPFSARYRQDRLLPVEGPTGWLSGACLVLRRSVFEELAGFDPSYFMFFEDVDLCHRIKDAGWERVYVPSATVVHVGGHSWRGKRSPQMNAAHHQSAKHYLGRQYPAWYQGPLRWVLGVGLTLRAKLSS